jgi:hypothetical protein
MFVGQIKKFFPSFIKKYVFVDKGCLDDLSIFKDFTVIYYDQSQCYKDQFLSCIEQVPENFCIYTNEDYILYDTVNQNKIQLVCDILSKEDHSIGFIKFVKGSENLLGSYKSYDSLFEIDPNDSNFFTQQAAIWRTRTLQSVFYFSPQSHIGGYGGEQQEVVGSDVCRQLKIRGLQYYDGGKLRGQVHYDSNIFPYINTAIVRGKWNILEYYNELMPLFSEYKIKSYLRGYHDLLVSNDSLVSGQTNAPMYIPDELYEKYTRWNGNDILVIHDYRNNSTADMQAEFNKNFTNENLLSSIKRSLNNEENYYGATDSYLYKAFEKYSIGGKSVLITGSAFPWYEGVCIGRNVSKCVVSEYSDRSLSHPLLQYIKPDEINEKFDYILSISSFENDGLGRYGDPLDPDGDLKTMENMKKYLKPGGKMFLSVPIGIDILWWNSRRHYGQYRLPMLLKGWKVLDMYGIDLRSEESFKLFHYGNYQPLLVIEPTS